MVRRQFSRDIKLEACRRAEAGGETKAHICREFAISASLLEKWLEQFRAKGEEAFDGTPWRPEAGNPEARVRQLEAALGRAHLEIEFLKECLGKFGRPKGGGSR